MHNMIAHIYSLYIHSVTVYNDVLIYTYIYIYMFMLGLTYLIGGCFKPISAEKAIFIIRCVQQLVCHIFIQPSLLHRIQRLQLMMYQMASMMKVRALNHGNCSK